MLSESLTKVNQTLNWKYFIKKQIGYVDSNNWVRGLKFGKKICHWSNKSFIRNFKVGDESKSLKVTSKKILKVPSKKLLKNTVANNNDSLTFQQRRSNYFKELNKKSFADLKLECKDRGINVKSIKNQQKQS